MPDLKFGLVAYLAAAVPFWILDLVWLGVIAKKFYAREMGDLLAKPFYMPAAIAFYLIYPIGIAIFAVVGSATFGHASPVGAALIGALFGFFCYATYDLTCLAVIAKFPRRLALVDMLWGTLLSGAAAAIGVFLMRGLAITTNYIPS